MNWRGHDLPTTKIRQHDFTCTWNFSHTTHTVADGLASSDSCFLSFFLPFPESSLQLLWNPASWSTIILSMGQRSKLLRSIRDYRRTDRAFFGFYRLIAGRPVDWRTWRAFPLLALCPIPHSIPPFIPLTGLFQIGTGSWRQGYLLLQLLSFAIAIYRPSSCINMHMKHDWLSI